MIPVSKRWPAVALLAALIQAHPLQAATVLENDYVRVSRDDAPCALASTPGCAERVIVAMGEIQLRFGKVLRAMRRGEVAVFKAGESYRPPEAGAYFEVAIKPNHPPVKAPAEIIPPEKNTIVHDSERFFIYEERLAPGTRASATATASASRSASTRGRSCARSSTARTRRRSRRAW